MALIPSVLVTFSSGVVAMTFAVIMGTLAVDMGAMWRASITIGVHVRMQAAQLQGEQAETRGQHNRRA